MGATAHEQGLNAQISHGDVGPCPAQKNGRSFDGAARPRTWPAQYEARAPEMPPNHHQQPMIPTTNNLRT